MRRMSVNQTESSRRTDDESLALAMRDRGDHDAFASLCERHTQAILAYTHSRVFDRTEAEDVSQDVWVKVWRFRGQFTELGVNSFRKWLFRIASRTCIDANRRKRPDCISDELITDLGDDRFDAPDWTVVVAERQSVLESCIGKLPSLQQCIVRATLTGEMTGSAAELCSCSAAQASKAKHLAAKSLRDCTRREGV
jgi:RNA polymerase sigma-70 factor (ECF subfamily)